jgi:hypothetical protein
MTYKEAKALVKQTAAMKYGDALAARLTYLLGGVFEKGSRDITQKTADRTVKTLTRRFTCSEKQLRRVLEKLDEIEVQEWRNRKVSYKFNPEPLVNFDLERAVREFDKKDKTRLEKQAERMRQRRAAERERQKREELLQFLRQYQQMSVADLISTIEQENSLKGANAAQ